MLVQKNPNNLTGGEEGLPLAYEKLPSALVGVVNTKHLYWLALGYLVFVVLVVRWSLASSPGHVWRAIRENEQRVEVIGLRPFAFKLLSFVIASFLATLGGIVYLLLLGTGASPQVVSASFTLSLLVMVVIGGTGTLWGADPRRVPLHLPRPAPAGVRRQRADPGLCRPCSGSRSRSRSSSSACSSS